MYTSHSTINLIIGMNFMEKILQQLTLFFICLFASCLEAVPYAYALNSGSSTISVIDINTNTVVNTISLSATDFPELYGIAITHNGKYAYVAGRNNVLGTIDLTTNTLIHSSIFGAILAGVSIAPNGQYAYVVDAAAPCSFYPFNIASQSPLPRIPTDASNSRLTAITPNGKYAYVTNQDNSISIIDLTTNTFLQLLEFGNEPFGIVITHNGKYAYITNGGANYVSILDLASNTVVDSIPVGNNPYYIAIAPGGKRAYIANSGDNTVSILNLTNNTVVGTIPVGRNPRGVAISPEGHYAYVTNYNDNTVSVIDLHTETVIKTISVGTRPYPIATKPHSSHKRLIESISSYGGTPFVPLKGVTP